MEKEVEHYLVDECSVIMERIMKGDIQGTGVVAAVAKIILALYTSLGDCYQGPAMLRTSLLDLTRTIRSLLAQGTITYIS
jgi:hypothetical protein